MISIYDDTETKIERGHFKLEIFKTRGMGLSLTSFLKTDCIFSLHVYRWNISLWWIHKSSCPCYWCLESKIFYEKK